MRWIPIALLALLAGCSGPSPEPDVATDAAVPARPPTHLTFHGVLQGAGYGTDMTGGTFVGTFSPDEDFTVDAGAIRLLFDLAWTTAAPHGVVYLFYEDPQGATSFIQPTGDQLLAGHLVHEISAPEPGIWKVSARTNGASADVEYTIGVTIEWET